MKRLTSKEVTKIASKLNDVINIPVLSEEKEQIIFEKAIGSIDNALYHALPDEIYDLVHTASDGITEQEARTIRKRLPKIINPYINIAIISEEQEEKLIEKFLDIIEVAIQKGKSIFS